MACQDFDRLTPSYRSNAAVFDLPLPPESGALLEDGGGNFIQSGHAKVGDGHVQGRYSRHYGNGCMHHRPQSTGNVARLREPPAGMLKCCCDRVTHCRLYPPMREYIFGLHRGRYNGTSVT